MELLTDDYTSYVMEQYAKAKKYSNDPLIRVELKLDFSQYVPEGFGTGDCVIVSDHLLHIIDFKYGKGVKVVARDNPQMKLYALGALAMFGNLYNIDEVETTIFQPRMGNISTWTIPVKDLMHWANTELKEKAELAFMCKGSVRYGPWCQFSTCNTVLRARYDYHHKLERFQLASPHLLTNAEVAEVLEHIDDLNRWAHEVKAYATDFEQVQEKLKQQIVRKPKQQPTPPTKFYRGIIKKYSDDAFEQAEHIYQLIYSEVEVYGES